jgi:hypothetical protein
MVNLDAPRANLIGLVELNMLYGRSIRRTKRKKDIKNLDKIKYSNKKIIPRHVYTKMQ